MNESQPLHTELVLVGGGHSHVEVIRQVAKAKLDGVRVTLVSRDVLTPYSGMLPGLIAGHYSVEDSHIDLRRLCRYAGVRFIHTPVTAMDADNKRLELKNRPGLSYDLVSIDIGSSPDLDSIEGARNYAIGVKPVDVFLQHWQQLERNLTSAEASQDSSDSPADPKPLTLVIIGAGAGGVELSLSLHHRLTQLVERLPRLRFDITIVAGHTPLSGHNARVRELLFAALEQRGIHLLQGRRVVRVNTQQVELDDGQRLDFDQVYALTSARPAPWLQQTGLTLDARGFIAVANTLKSVSHDTVFAAGDVAVVNNTNLPRAGVYAVRQGPILSRNLIAAVRGERLKPYRPQPSVLALISTGDQFAIASKGPLAIQGKWVWAWKDWIDKRWMEKYQRLTLMMDAQAPTDMPCAGCAAKVSAHGLRQVLAAHAPKHPAASQAASVMIGVETPDDASVIVPPAGQVLVQSVDHLRSFIDDPWLFADITTLHCVNDILAMGARPDSALVALTLDFTVAGRTNSDFMTIMDAIAGRFESEGITLIGGHTAEGAELSLGLTVNGFADADRIIAKQGAQPGDRLVLTKALGTGVVLAADMRGVADDDAMRSVIDNMRQSNREATNALKDYDVHAMTDVTGFGLAGHLVEMLTDTPLQARINVSDLPAIDGSVELLNRGYRSSLHLDNEVSAGPVSGGLPPALLFDPQTSGPMLVAINAGHAANFVDQLQSLGYRAARDIGEVQARPNNNAARLRIEH